MEINVDVEKLRDDLEIIQDKSTFGRILGLFTGMFSLTATGITATIIFSFIFTLIFKAKN